MIEPRYCLCGCGQKTALITSTHAKSGRIRGQFSRWVNGHNGRGRNGAPGELIVADGLTIRAGSAARFWAKVDRDGDCWVWTGSLMNGYGRFYTGLRPEFVGAHRVSYLLTGGHLDKSLVLDHLCKNKRCVRPLHLEQVTARENARRGNRPVLGAPDERPTHCVAGHELTADIVYIEPGPRARRRCRLCRRVVDQRRRERRAALSLAA